MAVDANYATSWSAINGLCGGTMEVHLDPHSSRAAEARFYASCGKIIKILSLALSILLSLLGVVLLLAGQAVGWLILSVGLWLLVPFFWVRLHLHDLPAAKHPHSISDVLSGEVLGVLSHDVNPQSLVAALANSGGANFLSARLGISLSHLAEVTPTDVALMNDVWNESLNIWTHLPNRPNTISAAIVIAAVIRLNPATNDMLNSLRIDHDDVYSAVVWYEHIGQMAQALDEPMLTGGIARDWSFGYIPTLERFGTNLSKKYSKGSRSIITESPDVQDAVTSMVNLLSSGARRNVALIGPFGAGKSTIVESLAEVLMDSQVRLPAAVRFNQVFMLDASAIISASRGRGQVEQLVNQLMVEAYKAKNIILFLDNAELFFEDGTGSIDLSNLLQPVIEGGGLKLIMAMDQQRYLQIAQTKPALANSLNRIEIKPADRAKTLSVLEDRAISIEYNSRCLFTYQSLVEAYRLSSRYINDVAQPRASLQLLENAVQQAESGRVTPASIAATIEKTLGIKVGGDLSYGDGNAERERLLNLENLIHERMINQESAVRAVASALRRARAGVRNEKRPIGTFLFLGPTGVGKTELAKSLAAVYFGGEDHLVRIDLNEYVRSEDVARLIADGATDPMSLSAQVRKNPFSVVLLDEIEKAHPNVLTTLLQVLDEGVLRDINNREVSFRDTILIATSNAGADRIRQYIDAGYQIEQFSQQIQDELISSGQFKPEFLNRFDEIAVFRPLTKDELVKVVDLILAGINQNLTTQKVTVIVDDDAKRLLVDAGYDPRLGARPMRRVVQRTVENIVAEKMLQGQLVPGSGIRLSMADIQQSLAQS